jgi:YjbE family integral membrane protein
MVLQDIGIVIAIILVDLALSGDNALVIGSVAAKLHGATRRRAITFGGLIAIVLRIALTLLAVFLLRIPFINLLGGLLVFVIAVQLVRDIDTEPQKEAEMEQAATQDDPAPRKGFRQPLTSDATFMRAITTIALADLSMSLDNALAIAALARQNLVLLGVGLFFSVILLLVASAFIAALIARFPLLMYLSGLILAITAGTMVLGDPKIVPLVQQWDVQVPGPLYYELLAAIVVLFGVIVLIARPHGNQRANG